MKRLGGVTHRWVNGADIVPTLPPPLPGMAEPFQQLPAAETLWRARDGACAKAVGAQLLDCPAAAAAAAAGGEPAGEEGGAPAAEEDAAAAGAGGKRGGAGGGRRRGKGREERCSYAVGDHRLVKTLLALSRCAAAEAEGEGGECATAVRGLMPRLADEARGRR
jgi:hypothetical protein